MAILYQNEEPKYPGRVLAVREKNFADESDFYAIVYDDVEDKVKEIIYGSTRFAGSGFAEPDAPKEIHELAKAAWVRDKFQDFKERTIEYLKIPVRGSRIKVVKGRKNKHGRTGKVEFIKTKRSKFDRRETYTIVGFIPDDDPEVLAIDYLSNVEAIDVEIPTDIDLLNRLIQLANKGAYLQPDYRPGVVVL